MKTHQKFAFLFIIAFLYPITTVFSQIPTGWDYSGRGFDVSLDRNIVYSGKNSVHFSLSPNDSIPVKFINLFQCVQTKKFWGKRIRLSAYIKTNNIKDEAYIYLSVRSNNSDTSINDNSKPIKGTNDWTNKYIVVDIPTTASILQFGVIISSSNDLSEAWVDNFKIEEVDKNVQLTKKAINETPINLNFDE